MPRVKNTKPVELPVPAKVESRICIGIAYFLREEDAEVYGKAITRSGATYNGGFFHGMQCGREPSRDYTDKALGRLYAVTTR